MFKTLLPLALAATALPAAADAPIYLSLPGDHPPHDVATYQGDVIVVGIETSGNLCFRWRLSTGLIEYLGVVGGGDFARVSHDGTQICTSTRGPDAKTRMARWAGGQTWIQLPDLGGSSGNNVSRGYGISGDGLTYVGSSYLSSEIHAVAWTQAGGLVDLGGSFGSGDSQIFAADFDGNVLAGRRSVPSVSGVLQGTRWVNGVATGFVYSAAGQNYRLGDANAVNGPGTVIVGTKALHVSGGANLAKGWRWDAGPNTTMLLDNYPGQSATPEPIDVTDDGTLILGRDGTSPLGDPQAVVWVNNVAQRLDDWLTSLGSPPPTEREWPQAISADGAAIVGHGSGLGSSTDPWIIIFPEKLEIGTPFCSGDGSGTACPCQPVPLVGDPGKGCPNSFSAGGGKLAAHGPSSITNDALVMTCTLINNGGAVVFQGTNDNGGGLGTAFGDGLRCAAGTVRRMRSHPVTTNTYRYPDPMFGDNAISIRGAVVAPGDRFYQGWYRSGLAHCNPTQNYNLTNALKVTWGL